MKYRNKQNIALISLGAILLLFSCARRDRTNPFDPNGKTQTNVFDLQVKSNPNEVILDWVGFNSPDLTGYNVYRAILGNPLQQIAQTGQNIDQFIDTSIDLNTEYVYGISALGQVDESPLSRLDTITPGNSRWWVLSSNYAPLCELSHDGLHLYSTSNRYYNPDFVAPANNPVAYVYDPYGGTIFRQKAGEEPTKLATGVDYLNSMFYNATTNQIIADYRLNNRQKLLVISASDGSTSELPLGNTITAIAQDSRGRVWAATTAELFVINLTNNNAQTVTNLATGFRIFDLETGPNDLPYILAENRNAIYQLQSDNSIDSLVEVQNPYELRFDASNNLLWIRAYDDVTKRFRVEQFDGQQTQVVLDGLQKTLTFDVDPASHSCLIPDYNTQVIYTITADGKIRHRKNVAGSIYYARAQSIDN